MNIAVLLKNARKARELTLAQVAKDTGIALSTINSWERNASAPRGRNREIIAKYYKLPPESLDYTLVNQDGSRSLDMGQVTQSMAMSDYETKPIMLHKKLWEMTKNVMAEGEDVDLNEMFTRLIKAAAKE